MDHEQWQAPSREDREGKGARLGGLWILLLPAVCCGGPLIIGALAAAGALAWGALGPGLALVLATAVAVILVVRRRRRSRACCPPAPAGATQPADRFPAR